MLLAIPDHPWTKATPDAAMVRIAMTVVARGRQDGRRLRIISERGLDSDTPDIRFSETVGRINADLSVGANVSSAQPLLANAWLCSRGVSLHGAGFIVSPAEAEMLGLGRREGLERHIRPYRNGRDLTARARGVMVIDLLGLSETEVRQRFPEVYGHVLREVKPERDGNARATYRDQWWLFGEPRRELRPALEGLSRYIATVETAKHRIFQFLDADTLPDNKLICIATADSWILGMLQSSTHEAWYLANAGMLGVYDQPAVYVKTTSFDPFPFPDAGETARRIISELADELDATRKRILAQTPDLTLTGLYNLHAKLITGEPLSDEEEDQRRAGSVDLIARLHEQIDAAVIAAYGWPAGIRRRTWSSGWSRSTPSAVPRNGAAASGGCAPNSRAAAPVPRRSPPPNARCHWSSRQLPSRPSPATSAAGSPASSPFSPPIAHAPPPRWRNISPKDGRSNARSRPRYQARCGWALSNRARRAIACAGWRDAAIRARRQTVYETERLAWHR